MKSPTFASKLFGDVWCCTPEAHRQLSETVQAFDWMQDDDYTDDEAGSLVMDGIMYIHVEGMIVPKATDEERRFFGLADVATINAQLDGAEIRDDVYGVLMVYDSPGGYIGGVPELSARIANFPKPIVGYVAGGCHSAAYWMAASQPLIAGPVAGIGSIGCYLVMYDASKRFEMMGVRSILISTGEHKGAGAMGTRLTDEHIQHISEEIIKPIGAMFAGHISTSRRIDETLMDGRSWLGARAEELGLIDQQGDMEVALETLKTLIGGL